MSKPLYGERFEYSVVNDLLTTELAPLLTKTFSFDLKSISLLSQRRPGSIVSPTGMETSQWQQLAQPWITECAFFLK